MTRRINRLTTIQVRSAPPGRHVDGLGLVLDVVPSGARSWTFVFRWQGRRPEMGLGGFPAVSLADARAAADVARRQVRDGINPITSRPKSAATLSFGPFADSLLDDLEKGWKNHKHRQQWRNTLATYAAPIWNTPVPDVTTDDVLRCLRPIWDTKAETASRVRGRIELVLSAAEAKGLRSGKNPAQWKGHLERLLPRRKRLTRGHHAALPYKAIPEFFVRLRSRQSVSALCLEWTILTTARTGEAVGARWTEINRHTKVWTVPKERMKSKRAHRVPLSDQAMKILDEVFRYTGGVGVIFPTIDGKRPLSDMAMTMALRDLVPNITVHGFRSTFRDWAGDETEFPREVIEAALAHLIGDKAEAAYRRGDALEKRRSLMQAWADYATHRCAMP